MERKGEGVRLRERERVADRGGEECVRDRESGRGRYGVQKEREK